MEDTNNSNFKKTIDFVYKIYHFVAKVFLYSILIILLLVAVGFTFYFVDTFRNIKNGVNKSPLLNAYIIISPSMEPTIKVEDAIVVMRQEPEELEVKDIITFISNDPRYSGLTITHRIVGIEKSSSGQFFYRTKGDNNNTEDSTLVPSDNVLGKVILKIPKIGYIQYVLTQSFGWVLLVVVPCLGIIIFDILKLIKSIKNSIQKPKSKQKKEQSEIEIIEGPKENKGKEEKVIEVSEDKEKKSSKDDIEII